MCSVTKTKTPMGMIDGAETHAILPTLITLIPPPPGEGPGNGAISSRPLIVEAAKRKERKE